MQGAAEGAGKGPAVVPQQNPPCPLLVLPSKILKWVLNRPLCRDALGTGRRGSMLLCHAPTTHLAPRMSPVPVPPVAWGPLYQESGAGGTGHTSKQRYYWSNLPPELSPR